MTNPAAAPDRMEKRGYELRKRGAFESLFQRIRNGLFECQDPSFIPDRREATLAQFLAQGGAPVLVIRLIDRIDDRTDGYT